LFEGNDARIEARNTKMEARTLSNFDRALIRNPKTKNDLNE